MIQTAVVRFPDCQAGFARLRQMAERTNGRRNTPLFAADPDRAVDFTAHFDDLSPECSRASIDAAERYDDLSADRHGHDSPTDALIKRIPTVPGGANGR
jgi:hypothetical protein